jgi:hypothetical protein
MTFKFARLCSVGNKSSDSTFSIDIKPGECTLHARSCGAGIGMFLVTTMMIVMILVLRLLSYFHLNYILFRCLFSYSNM